MDVDAGVVHVRFPTGTTLGAIERALDADPKYACTAIDLLGFFSREDGFDLQVSLDADAYAPGASGKLTVTVTAHDYRRLESADDAAPTVRVRVTGPEKVAVEKADLERAEPIEPEASATFVTGLSIATDAPAGERPIQIKATVRWALGKTDVELPIPLTVAP